MFCGLKTSSLDCSSGGQSSSLLQSVEIRGLRTVIVCQSFLWDATDGEHVSSSH